MLHQKTTLDANQLDYSYHLLVNLCKALSTRQKQLGYFNGQGYKESFIFITTVATITVSYKIELNNLVLSLK